MLGTVKDVRLRLPPLAVPFGIPDRPCAPHLLDSVGVESAPDFRPDASGGVEQKAAYQDRSCGSGQTTRENLALW